MPNITIRVGATGDASLATVFAPLHAATARARAQVEAETAKAGKAIGDNVKKGTDAADKEFAKLAKQADKWRQQMVRDAEKALTAEQRAVEKAAAAELRVIEKTMKDSARMHEQAERERTRTTERESATRARANDRASARTTGAVANISGRIASGALHAGTRFAGDLARGSGVQTDVSSMFSQGVSLEKRATDLSNQGYMPGADGVAGQRQDPRAIIAQVRAASDAGAMDPEKAIEGLQKFVAKTGDLQTGRDLLADMAKLSRASGASMEDMVDAAGDVSNGLNNVPNKAEKVKQVMQAMAAQGKVGAVEIKDLATQMAKLQAAAGQFSGSSTVAMTDMGVLTQMARAHGGASSATQAATSVGSFVSTFDKGARLDKFDKYGVKVKADDGMNRRGIDIIKDALAATGGDDRKMGEMFAMEGSKKVVRGWTKTYREAGGGDAGIEAVTREYEKLAAATMNQTEVNESLAASMNTTEAKVQLFNNTMSKSADEVRANLMPALVSLAPVIVELAAGVASLSGKLTGKTEQDADDAARRTDLKSHGDRLQLVRGAMTGEVSGKDVKIGEEDVAAMDAAIAQKKKKIADNEYSEPTRVAMRAGGFSKILDAHDEKQNIDKSQLDAMLAENKQMKDLLHSIANGELRVRVTNPHEMKPAPGGVPLPRPNPGATLPGPTPVHDGNF